jgi:hypothetical protein
MPILQDGKLLPQSQIFQKQVMARADRANKQNEREPQRTQHEILVSKTPFLQGKSAVGFAAMMYAANFDHVGIGPYNPIHFGP